MIDFTRTVADGALDLPLNHYRSLSSSPTLTLAPFPPLYFAQRTTNSHRLETRPRCLWPRLPACAEDETVGLRFPGLVFTQDPFRRREKNWEYKSGKTLRQRANTRHHEPQRHVHGLHGLTACPQRLSTLLLCSSG